MLWPRFDLSGTGGSTAALVCLVTCKPASVVQSLDSDCSLNLTMTSKSQNTHKHTHTHICTQIEVNIYGRVSFYDGVTFSNMWL